MKKLVLILFLISFGMNAQDDRNERIKALKIAYITEQLNLSSSEAERFWPVYNDHEEKMMSLRKKERREVFQRFRDGAEDMSNEEANELLDIALTVKTKELEFLKDLVANLRPVISPKKIIKLKKVEEDFKRRLLERFKQRRGNR